MSTTTHFVFLLGIIFLVTSTTCSQVVTLDSAAYRSWLIERYLKDTGKDTGFEYNADAYTKREQDSLFTQAIGWRKFHYEYPMILHYLNIAEGTPEAQQKIAYLENPSHTAERQELLIKSHELFVREHSTRRRRHIAAGLSTTDSTGIKNHDKEIKDKVLKDWKF